MLQLIWFIQKQESEISHSISTPRLHITAFVCSAPHTLELSLRGVRCDDEFNDLVRFGTGIRVIAHCAMTCIVAVQVQGGTHHRVCKTDRLRRSARILKWEKVASKEGAAHSQLLQPGFSRVLGQYLAGISRQLKKTHPERLHQGRMRSPRTTSSYSSK